MIVLCGASIGSRLTRRQTDHAGFRAAIAVSSKRSAEPSRLIVRMRGDTHQPKHGLIVSNVQSFAETAQSFAARKNSFLKTAHPKYNGRWSGRQRAETHARSNHVRH